MGDLSRAGSETETSGHLGNKEIFKKFGRFCGSIVVGFDYQLFVLSETRKDSHFEALEAKKYYRYYSKYL